ncbi:BLUF domain-containing protein [Polymorphobacter fuscus]|uniref:Blue light sensor protein n=1 Tax=Sandarakinorhabdus fusca TaxID=1439888 RepID=A0A7C9GPC9_9SPHN|nr:BLUF domain-containing protein [Polymorphobacter fuscus]KAB7646239.1 BLUF domain-containing protein [Polymorphobacter fuscus]MQT17452.1 blue light sensor protein [Polymorphobacter fuscus]NJC10011.1 hypothetical protein [Polymorphobacter fuscus]
MTFISESLIPAGDSGAAVAAIVARADTANLRNGITGALLFTGGHFVQTLEGHALAVDATMGRIASDARHHQLVIVDRRRVRAPGFDRWSLGYCGRSLFVAETVHNALAGRRRDVDRMLALVRAFSAPSERSPRS